MERQSLLPPFRLALLSAHYRQPLQWADELVEQATKSLDRLYGALRRDPEGAAALASGPEGAQWDTAVQLQFRTYELERLRGILNSPPHRAVDLMSRQVRRLPGLRRAVTALLHAAVGRIPVCA